MKKTPKELKDNYIVIQSWMSRTLNLKGNCLIIYALIYGFSQTDKQLCTCGDDYMAAWINGTTRGILNIKNELIERGLIEKVDAFDGDKRVAGYRALPVGIPEKSSDISKKTPEKVSHNLHRKHQKSFPKIPEKSSPDNKYIINNNTNLSVSHSAPAREDGTDGRTKEKLFFAECIQQQLKGLDVIEKADMIQRLTDITDQLLRLKTVTIGGLEIDSVEVLKAIFDLFRDGTYERLNDALFVGVRSDVKNKFGYTVAALYNAAKQF